MTSKIYPQHPRYKVDIVSPTFENIASRNDTIKQSENNVVPSSSEPEKIILWSTVFWIGLGALLFIALVIIVVVPIAALANTAEVNTTIDTTTVSTICPTTAITTTVMSGSLPSECINYTTITDPTRSPDYSATSSCDIPLFSNVPMWVRFTGSGGTILATCPMDESRCGTDYPGWYSGIHPSEAGTVTSGYVCFTYDPNFCDTTVFILVANCNGFYVYYLTAPSYCNTRYCTI